MHINRKIQIITLTSTAYFYYRKLTVLYCKTNGILCCSALSKFKDHQVKLIIRMK